MARQLLNINTFFRGISPSDKLGDAGYFNFARNLDIYSEPSAISLNVRTVSESGASIIGGLVKWIVLGTPYDTNAYLYDWDGKIYKRTSGGAYSLLRSVTNSSGEGMEIFNDYIYYAQNTQLGRYGPLSGVPSFTDNWQTGLNGTTISGSGSVEVFSPIKAFRAGFAVGNGNDLGWYDGSVWTQNRLVLPPDFKIQCLEVVDEFLAIAASGAGQNYVFFWDGDATNYNFFIKVDDGKVQAMVNFHNQLFAVVGEKSKLMYLYPTYKDLIDIPKLKRYDNLTVFPGALTVWNGIVHIGIASGTNSDDLVQGVYQWGSISDDFPEALNFGYTISPDLTTGISVGALKVIGRSLYISWGVTGVNQGVDKVVVGNACYASGSIEFLIYDGGDTTREDLALNLKAYYSALNSGEAIQLGYKTNRNASYTLGVADTTAGDSHTRLPVDSDKARFYEFQFEVLFTGTSGSGDVGPILYGVSLKSDNLMEEQKV